MKLRFECQNSRIEFEAAALFALVRPILKAMLYSLKGDIVRKLGDYSKIDFELLSRLYKEGNGDMGICFEYAVHEAIETSNPLILDRIDTSLHLCHITKGVPSSLLFGGEKSGALNLVNSVLAKLTDDSTLLYGGKGRPVKLKRHIQTVNDAFRKNDIRNSLPHSIRDTWKADLFIGKPESDQWVATTLKINERDLEGGKGLRIGIVPMTSGTTDRVRYDVVKDLIICPLPYDYSFMEFFVRAFKLVKATMKSCSDMPALVDVPEPADRLVCKEILRRHNFPVLDIISSLADVSQKHLLNTDEESLNSYETHEAHIDQIGKTADGYDDNTTTITPIPLI